jgi:hypothetical protein
MPKRLPVPRRCSDALAASLRDRRPVAPADFFERRRAPRYADGMSGGGMTCPSCGGSGGGPFGRPGSAWDVETYVCPRCRGAGSVHVAAQVATPATAPSPQGLAKAAPRPAEHAPAKPGIAGTRPASPRTKRRSSTGA